MLAELAAWVVLVDLADWVFYGSILTLVVVATGEMVVPVVLEVLEAVVLQEQVCRFMNTLEVFWSPRWELTWYPAILRLSLF